jgi:hypothetical protein
MIPEGEADVPTESGGGEAWRGRILVSILAFAAVAAAFKIRAYDLFWHLAAGHWILQTRALPDPDPFRFTSQGAPWVDHEWLFQVVLATIENIGGLTGLWAVRIALALCLTVILWVAARRAGAPVIGAAMALFVTLLGARPRFFLRPEFPTLVALALLVALLSEFRRGRQRWPVAVVLLLTLFWANSHPGSLMAPILCGTFLLGTRLPGGWGSPRRGLSPMPWSWILGLPAAMVLIMLLNPAGWRLFAVPVAISGALDSFPGVNPEWLPVWKAPQPFLFIGLAMLVLLVAQTYRCARRLDPATGLVTLALTTLTSTSMRHQAPLFVGAFFLASECLAELDACDWKAPIRSSRARLLPPLACLLGIAWCLWPPTGGPLAPRQGRYTFGSGLEPGRFPDRAVDFIEQIPELGNLYNNVAFGGYLLWRLYPPRQIFNDGRSELNPELLRELAAARQDSRAWTALLDRYEIDGALVRYDRRRRPVIEPPLVTGGEPEVVHLTSNTVLFAPDRFALVHWDDLAMVFLERRSGRRQLLEQLEYHFVNPEDPESTLQAASNDPAKLKGARLEVERRLREDPDCRLAASLQLELTELADKQFANADQP